jgi:hypothetical protein
VFQPVLKVFQRPSCHVVSWYSVSPIWPEAFVQDVAAGSNYISMLWMQSPDQRRRILDGSSSKNFRTNLKKSWFVSEAPNQVTVFGPTIGFRLHRSTDFCKLSCDTPTRLGKFVLGCRPNLHFASVEHLSALRSTPGSHWSKVEK